MAANGKIIDLKFPVGGVARRYAFQQAAPYTTPIAVNVRPFDTLAGRERGGSRPGISKFLDQVLGEGNPIQLLHPVWIVDNLGWNSTLVLLAASNGSVYRSQVNDAGTLEMVGTGAFDTLTTETGVDLTTEDGLYVFATTAASTSATLPTIQGTQRGLKFYLADHAEPRAQGSDGIIATGNKLSAVSITDWTDLDIDTNTDLIVLVAADGSSVESGAYRIASVTTGYIVIDGTITPKRARTTSAGP